MILNDFNYFNFFKKKDDYYKREKNIQHFFDIIRTWEEKKNFTSFFELISEFYQWIIISFEDKSLLKTYENLTLSSVHQAKGLEFKTIFFIYLDLGIIPFWKSIDIIEEKRIFYVGITRAKENLFLFSSVGRSSFFLKQIESKYLEKKIYLNL